MCRFRDYALENPITFLLPPSLAFSISSIILNRIDPQHAYYEPIRLTATLVGLSPLFLGDYCERAR